MYPMDFEEFLWVNSDRETMQYLKKCFEEKEGGALHRIIMKKFRTYLLTGGMPQTVSSYIKDKDFGICDEKKKNIITLYRNDIYKFGDGNKAKALAIYDNIPGQLLSGNKKFFF